MVELLQVARRVRHLVVSVHPELHALSLPAPHGLGDGNDADGHALLQQSLLVLVDPLRLTPPPRPHVLRVREQLAARAAHGGLEHLLWRQHAVRRLSTPHASHPPPLAHQRAAGVAHHVGRHSAGVDHLVGPRGW